ncbi:hypothetical protein PCL_03267 [Purpureocillium lilacinum]|uniref:DUF8035 domain-containing protein n=2 Tax=Purpureocillium lilacinum TaxID=33203 RepID=A0A2U3ENJ1_PURLI|nr:hypothetical protein PCL_03267 [Purpureocillium lilacinum]
MSSWRGETTSPVPGPSVWLYFDRRQPAATFARGATLESMTSAMWFARAMSLIAHQFMRRDHLPGETCRKMHYCAVVLEMCKTSGNALQERRGNAHRDWTRAVSKRDKMERPDVGQEHGQGASNACCLNARSTAACTYGARNDSTWQLGFLVGRLETEAGTAPGFQAWVTASRDGPVRRSGRQKWPPVGARVCHSSVQVSTLEFAVRWHSPSIDSLHSPAWRVTTLLARTRPRYECDGKSKRAENSQQSWSRPNGTQTRPSRRVAPDTRGGSRLKLGLMFINDQSVWPGRSNTSVRPGWDMVAAPRRDGMGKKRARAEHPGNTCGRHRWLDSPADGGANDDVMTDVTGPLKRTAGPVASGRDRSVRDPCLGAWRLGTKRVEAEARDSRGRSGGTGPGRCWGGGARSGRGLEGMEGEEQGREAPAQARVAGRPAEGITSAYLRQGGTTIPRALWPVMSGGSTLEHIDAVDAFARTLFIRAKQYPNPSLSDVSTAVRHLHLALRHLRVEAADPDSLLNRGTDSSVYTRQIQPIVQDSDFALKQLETVLDKYDANGGREVDGMADRLATVRSRLVNERTTVDMFLDTVQLHNPANKPPCNTMQRSDASLEGIKDKVDKIATKLFSRRDSTGMADDEDRLWQEFKSELEKEGFSPDVLRQHKEILRAYIRELETMSSLNGGAPPTVRGMLEQHSRALVPPPVPPKIPQKEVAHPSMDNEKCFVSMKDERRMPGDAPIPPPPHTEHYSFSSDDAGSDSGESMALISTKDLMAMDSIHSGMAGLTLHPPSPNGYGASPRSSQKYLTSGIAGTLPPPGPAELSGSPSSQLGSSPNYVHPLPPYGLAGQPPPTYGSSPRSMPPRLAPDRYGQEIPLDAPWTKIKRSLVSPEVLERAGVRYEARPEYVAILGRLSREQIAAFAQQSADCRAARSGKYAPPRRDGKYERPRADSKSSRDDDDDDSVLWDESDTTDYDDDKTSDKGTKSYPYIVNPPTKDKASPSSTVMPKPILKNKNENHVRFDPEPHEVDSRSGSLKDERDRRRDGGSRRYRDPRDKEGSGRGRDGHRRDGDRDRYSDRHRGYDGDHHRPYHRGDRERRGDRKEDRTMKKKAWGETLGAVGIGGAAASLLGVLAEAAVGM